MATRKTRDASEVDEILDRITILRDIRDEVRTIEGIAIEADGAGKCIFKLYVAGHTDSHEPFLRLLDTSDDEGIQGYVWWQHSPLAIKCREIFAGVVKSADNPDGSYLKPGVSDVLLCRKIRQYADATRTLS